MFIERRDQGQQQHAKYTTVHLYIFLSLQTEELERWGNEVILMMIFQLIFFALQIALFFLDARLIRFLLISL